MHICIVIRQARPASLHCMYYKSLSLAEALEFSSTLTRPVCWLLRPHLDEEPVRSVLSWEVLRSSVLINSP